MGHYSVHCCLSGIPIQGGDPAIGWHVQHTKFKDLSCTQWIPLTFPVVGRYDGYGRIVDHADMDLTEDDVELAICHKELWDQLPQLWDLRDGHDSLETVVTKIHEKFLQYGVKYLPGGRESQYTQAWLSIGSECNRFKWLKDICLGEPSKDDGVPYETRKDWPYEDCCGVFEKKLLDLIIIGPKLPGFTQICESLEKLLTAYTSTCYRGRPIMPTTTTFAVQDTDYKLEKKWFGFVNSKLTALRKVEVEREKQYRKEMKEWEDGSETA